VRSEAKQRKCGVYHCGRAVGEPWGLTVCPQRSGAEGKTKGLSLWSLEQFTPVPDQPE
jgi:hypothetical protein